MNSLLIWTYHRILPAGGSAAVTPEVLRRQIGHLRTTGRELLDCAGLADWFAGRLDRSRRYAVLTFDDGWADNWLFATPILAELHAKAVLAVNLGLAATERESSAPPRSATDFISADSKQALACAVYGGANSSFLNLAELREMARSGFWDIQAHGMSHFGCYADLRHIRGFYPEHWHWTMERALGRPPFPGAPRAEFTSELATPRTRLSDVLAERLASASNDDERRRLCAESGEHALDRFENVDEFRTRVRQDIGECRRRLKELLGVEARAFFWPWGHWSDEGVRIAAELGFELSLTMEKAAVTPSTNPLRIPRIAAPSSLEKFVRQERVFASPLLSAAHNLWRRLVR